MIAAAVEPLPRVFTRIKHIVIALSELFDRSRRIHYRILRQAELKARFL